MWLHVDVACVCMLEPHSCSRLVVVNKTSTSNVHCTGWVREGLLINLGHEQMPTLNLLRQAYSAIVYCVSYTHTIANIVPHWKATFGWQTDCTSTWLLIAVLRRKWTIAPTRIHHLKTTCHKQQTLTSKNHCQALKKTGMLEQLPLGWGLVSKRHPHQKGKCLYQPLHQEQGHQWQHLMWRTPDLNWKMALCTLTLNQKPTRIKMWKNFYLVSISIKLKQLSDMFKVEDRCRTVSWNVDINR